MPAIHERRSPGRIQDEQISPEKRGYVLGNYVLGSYVLGSYVLGSYVLGSYVL